MTNKKAIRILENIEYYLKTYTNESCEEEHTAIALAIKALKEKTQGEWLWLGDNPNPNHKWSCNKCGRGVKEQENFCPNCGAKMKGGAEL